MKSVRIRSFSDQYFPAFELNTERYSVFSPNAGIYGPENSRSVWVRENQYSGIFFALLQYTYSWRKGKLNVETVFLPINSKFCDI